MNLEEKTVSSEEKYNGKVVKLYVDEVQLPDGRLSKREYVKHSGGAAILLVKDGCVLLVKQYRYAYGQTTYEIPAGKLEKGEDPMLAAERELEEETGYVSKKTTLLNKIYPTPGYTNEIIYVYQAEDFVKREQKLDDGEFLNAEFIDISKVLRLIECGQICDAKTTIALYHYLLMKKS